MNGTISQVTGSGANYNVTVTGIVGDGILGLAPLSNASISDLANNSLSEPSDNQSYTIDQTGPSSVISNQPPAVSNSSVSFNFTADDPVVGGVATGVNHQEYSLDGSNFTLATSPLSLSNLSQGNHTLSLRAIDNVGNTGPSTTYNWTVNFDTTAPVVTSINRLSPATNLTNAGNVTYQVVFSENVTGVDASDFQLATNGTNGTITQVSGNGSSYTVNVSGITGNGSLGLTLLDNNSIRDLANHPLSNANAFTFSQPSNSFLGQSAIGASAGDLNGDGNTDLAFVNQVIDTLSVYLGFGNGTFQNQRTFRTGDFPRAMLLGDFNGDGTLDAAVANDFGDSLGILIGTGNGSFLPQVTYLSGEQPHGIAQGDLNRDGFVDLVLANTSESYVSVYLGTGNGTFQSQTTFAAAAYAQGVQVGDANGDGILDLFVPSTSTNSVSVLLGNGNGTFQNRATFATGTYPIALAVGDVNQDGKLDLAISNFEGDTVSILLGVGNGSFQPHNTYQTDASPFGIALGDLNGDGILDIAVANTDGQTVSLLRGNGNGTFQPQQTFVASVKPSTVALGDWNNDGRLDLAASSLQDVPLNVYLNGANGTFTGQAYTIDQANPTVGITAQPPVSTTNTSAAFNFTAADPVVGGVSSGVNHVEYKLDGGNFTIATSPLNLTGLSQGNHTFSLRAIDNVGNTGPSTTYNWTIAFETTPPVVTSINRLTPATSFTNAGNVTFQVTFSEAVTGVDVNDFVLSYAGNLTSSGSQLVAVNGSLYTFTVSGLVGNGTVGLNLRAAPAPSRIWLEIPC